MLMRKWEPPEIEFLNRNFSQQGGKYVAQKLGRPLVSVYHKAERLKQPPKVRQDAWTADDVAILRRDFSSQGAAAVAKTLGRSEISVGHKASRLGIYSDGSHWQRQARTQMEQATARGIKTLDAWKRRVKERDGFTCQTCGLYEPLIVTAHHIHHVSKGGDLHGVENGITLCPNCHALEHAIDGRKSSGHRVPPETYKQIRDLLQQGLSIETIASRTGYNRKTIDRHAAISRT